MAGVPAEQEDKASGRPKTHLLSLSTPFEQLEGGCPLADLRLRETARVMRSESHTFIRRGSMIVDMEASIEISKPVAAIFAKKMLSEAL